MARVYTVKAHCTKCDYEGKGESGLAQLIDLIKHTSQHRRCMKEWAYTKLKDQLNAEQDVWDREQGQKLQQWLDCYRMKKKENK